MRHAARALQTVFVAALSWFVFALQQGLSLQVSLTANGVVGKSRWLTSTDEARAALAAPMEGLGLTYAKEVRWLGCDYQPEPAGARAEFFQQSLLARQ